MKNTATTSVGQHHDDASKLVTLTPPGAGPQFSMGELSP